MNKNLWYPVISKYRDSGNIIETAISFALQHTPGVSHKDLCPFVKSHLSTLVGKGEKKPHPRIIMIGM